MNSTDGNRKSPTAKGVPQPLKKPTIRTPQFKPPVAGLKNAMSTQMSKRPVAPQVYRPQAPPVVVQPKSAVEFKKTQPIAPPVYRPLSEPKVLQRTVVGRGKDATRGVPNASLAPQLNRSSPTREAKLASQQNANYQLRLTPSHVKTYSQKQRLPAPPAHSANRVSTVQRSQLVRHNFSSEVTKTLTLTSGQHRRHIIANHLMKNMLQSWWDWHVVDKEGAKTSLSELQALLDKMNNNMKNLVPGPGPENSAIGMLSTKIGRDLEKFEDNQSTPTEIATSLGKFQGFQQGKQEELMTPILKTFTKDKEVKSSHEGAKEMAADIHFSTDFDWPGGNNFRSWHVVYLSFKDVSEKPGNYTYEQLMDVVGNFSKLKKPTGSHTKGQRYHPYK